MKTKSERILKFINGQMQEYFLFKKLDKYDPMLKERTKEFDFGDPPMHPTTLAISMSETMGKYGGVGLAAPQIGIPYRVFCIALMQLDRNEDKKKMNVITMFNPEITYQSENKVKALEGCITFPGMFLEIDRSFEIKIKFQNHFGSYMEMPLYGIDARCALHEYDHLDGILYTTKIPKTKLKLVQEKMRKSK